MLKSLTSVYEPFKCDTVCQSSPLSLYEYVYMNLCKYICVCVCVLSLCMYMYICTYVYMYMYVIYIDDMFRRVIR